MTTTKIAISVPADVLARARAEVARGRAPSLSAYVADALDQKAMLDELDAMLDAMLEESGGALREDEREQARSDLGLVAPAGGGARSRSGRKRRRA